jgi:uncharacterized membrane protein YfcA
MHDEMIAFGVFVAAIMSGATGLGFPLLAAPIFLLDYAPPQAIFITSFCSLIGQSFAIVILRQTVCYEVRWRLVVSGIVGVPIGTTLLLLSDTSILRFGLAILLVISSLWLLIGGSVIVRRAVDIPEMLIGVSGGICGGLFGVS